MGIQEIYVDEARGIMGYMFQSAVYRHRLTLEKFVGLFLQCEYSTLIEKGNPHYLVHYSGTELAIEVLDWCKDRSIIDNYHLGEQVILEGYSREYWIGWIVLFLQYKTGVSFKEIFTKISVGEFYHYYTCWHERNDKQTIEMLISKIGL